MTGMRRFLLCWGLLGLVGAVLVTAAIPICPKCGFENPEDAVKCVHCEADLPGAPAPSEPREGLRTALPEDVRDSGEFLDPSVVEAEIAKAREIGRQGDGDVAGLFLRNALALEMLTDPAQKSGRAGKILNLLKSTPEGGGKVTILCALCGGTGKRYMSVSSFSGDETQQEVYGAVCAACGGAGVVISKATPDHWKTRVGKARNEYELQQKGRRFVPVGRAWVPQELEGKLSIRQTAMLKRTLAVPCAKCLGSGRTTCGECRGAGKVKCNAPRCVGGYVKVEQKDGKLSASRLTGREKCPVCHGTTFVTCEECGGQGSRPCAACNGTGQRALCSKCSGQGYVTCARCAGAGMRKGAVCASCAGQGVALCSACNGDGRKK